MSIALGCTDQSGKENNESDQQRQNTTEKPNNNLNGDTENTDPEEKIKITIAWQWAEERFENLFRPIEEYLGNVEFEYVSSDGTLARFEEMFAEGIYPDIIVDQNIFALQDLDVIHYLDDLVEQTGFDMGIFDQAMVDSISAYDDEGRIIGFPEGTSKQAIYYNKEIFDLFGVEYPDPETPMTWDEFLDLAGKLTGERDGQQYFGLNDMTDFALRQFAPTATDPDTGEVLINENEAYKRYFELVANFYSIPGLEDLNHSEDPKFLTGLNLAMTLEGANAFSWMVENAEDTEPFDLAPLPVWPDRPDIGPEAGTRPMMITEYSENKEVALEVLAAYFEPELITESVRVGGMMPPLANEDLLSQYLKDGEKYEGKNIAAYHVLEHATPEGRVSKWDDYVDHASAVDAIREGTDVVTAMRELEEESEAKIKDAMAAE